ncbi:hypothetical protein cypCar_00017918 [Cyprinus carpio]|nr:hypothetical protein cypCar_00017918 [Cyprinus carpio]
MKEALKLSLKYQFVTPLTSMVVTKPQEEEIEVAEKPKEEGRQHTDDDIVSVYHDMLVEYSDYHVDPVIDVQDTYISPTETMFTTPLYTTTSPAVQVNRFLVSVVGQSKLLCFDIPVPHKLRLLQDSASGKADISYEETEGSQTPTLKIKDKEVKTSLETVSDYRLHSTPVRECWLVPFQAMMEAEISDFTVTQL